MALQGTPVDCGAFYVLLPYPPTLNTLWRRVGNRTLLSSGGRRYHEIVGAEVIGAKSFLCVPPPPHEVTLLVRVPDRRKRDIDNVFKAVLDPLYRAIGLDDSVIVDLHAHKRYAGGSASVGVTIKTAVLDAAPTPGRG